jgi:putative MATE family efflux protein
VFLTGSILRHVLVMTGSGAVGLIAVFLVDFLTLLYVARLGDPQATAAVAFATQALFVPLSLSIGMTIAVTALTARALGSGDVAAARRLAGASLIIVAAVSGAASLGLWLARGPFLSLLGASGPARDMADTFLAVALPSGVPLSLGMALSGVLRAKGDARRSMQVTLSGALVTAILDPVLIFGLKLGLFGAACTIIVARLAGLVVGWRGVRWHAMAARPTRAELVADLRPFAAIATPAIMTNLASPAASAFALSVISRFGDAAVGALVMSDRVFALGYAPIFALSGSVGAILAQNLGARNFGRLRETMRVCLLLSSAYCVAMWGALHLASPFIATLFDAPESSRDLFVTFMFWGSAAWVMLGWLFVANASFNNLGFPLLSTGFNWGRAVLGVIPFVALGARWDGARGAAIGMAAGSALFGAAALVATRVVLDRIERRAATKRAASAE